MPSAPTYSHRRCMEMINNQQADVAMFEVSVCVRETEREIYKMKENYGEREIMGKKR